VCGRSSASEASAASKANCSVIGHAEHSSASTDPVLGVLVGGQVHHHDEIGGVTSGSQLSSSLGSLVKRALVSPVKLEINLEDGFKPDNWELRDSDLVIHILNHLLVVIPFGSFDEVTMDVHSRLRELFNGLNKASHDVSSESELINFKAISTGMHLEGSSLETLREEEAGNPVAHGHAFLNPSAHEDDTLEEIIEPGAERLQRGVGPGDPHAGNLAIKEIIHHLFQSLRHNNSAFNSFIQVDQRLAHDVQEKVESLKLLS